MDWLRQVGKVIVVSIQEKRSESEDIWIYEQRIATTIRSVSIYSSSVVLLVDSFDVGGDDVSGTSQQIWIRGEKNVIVAAPIEAGEDQLLISVDGVVETVY